LPRVAWPLPRRRTSHALFRLRQRQNTSNGCHQLPRIRTCRLDALSRVVFTSTIKNTERKAVLVR